jgi:hypothetical protein
VLLSAFRFTKGLDLNARAYAEVTGIAVGWLRNEQRVFRCGCWVCEFVIEEMCGDRTPAIVQAATLTVFQLKVEKHGCLHWGKYVRYREEAPHEEFLFARNTLRKAAEKAEAEKSRVVEPIWELEVPEEAREEILDEDEDSANEALAALLLGGVEVAQEETCDVESS